MEARNRLILSEGHSLAWSLLLMRALDFAGLTPCDTRTIHRTIYFANVLAPIYDVRPPIELVMRDARGPYYPSIQHCIDRLCVFGFVHVQDLRVEIVGTLATQLGSYAISSEGVKKCRMWVDQLEWARSTSQYLTDVASALSSRPDDFVECAERFDETYNRPGSRTTARVISFGPVSGNETARVSELIRQMTPTDRRPVPQQAVKLYLSYLNQIGMKRSAA